jgi:hypothetical protein
VPSLRLKKTFSSAPASLNIRHIHMKSYSDRGFVTASLEGDHLLIKAFGDSVNLRWAIRDSIMNTVIVASLDMNPQGEALVAGFSRSDISGDYRGFMMKVSRDGKVLWQREYTPANFYSGIYSAFYLSTGDIIAMGFTSPLGGGDPYHFFLKTDGNGSVIRSNNLYISGIWGHPAVGRNNELYIYSWDAVVKVSENGQILWTVSLLDKDFEHTQSMAVGSDNSLYLIQTSPGSNALLKITDQGKILWRKELHIGSGTPRLYFLSDSLLLLRGNRVYRLTTDGEFARAIEFQGSYNLADISPACGGQYFLSGVSGSSKMLAIKTLDDLTTSCTSVIPAPTSGNLPFANTMQSRTSASSSFGVVSLQFQPQTVTLPVETLCYSNKEFKVDLGNDTIVCNNGEFVLDAGISHATYLWSTGETSRTIKVKKPGWHRVTVVSDCFGKTSDEIFVDMYQLPDAVFSLNPTEIEPGDSILGIDHTQNISGRRWLLADTLLSTGQQMKFTVQRNGIFELVLEIKDSFNCVTRWPKQFKAELFRAYVPNSFTPQWRWTE